MNRIDRLLRGCASFSMILLLLSIVWSPAPAQAVVIGDSAFSTSDWSEDIIFNTMSGAANFAVAQQSSGGNSGSFRKTTHIYTGPGGMVLGHRMTSASYDPSTQGAIGTLDFGLDGLFISQAGGSVPSAVGLVSFVFQNNSWYSAGFNVIVPTAGVWTSFASLGLVESDFALRLGAGASGPDFSANGGVIQFGFGTTNGSCCGGQNTVVSGVDNFSVVTNPGAVPEPGALTILGLGVVALGAARRKKAV
jgi:hypothetical protein